MKSSIDSLLYAADLTKRLGKSLLQNGETLENQLVLDEISLWTVVEPVLAAFSLPKALASKEPSSIFARMVRPYLGFAKQKLKSIPIVTCQSSIQWPPQPVCLFLGFSGYMYRDVLDPIVRHFKEYSHMNAMILHDEGHFQKSVVKLKEYGSQSIWGYRDKQIITHESILLGSFKDKIKYIKLNRTSPLFFGDVHWTQLQAIFKWLLITYLPSLIPYVVLARHILKKNRPAIIISPDVADPRTRIFCLAARSMGIPSLEVQFGLYGKDSVEWQFFLADQVSVWGGNGRQVLMEHGIPAEKIFITGSPRFDGLANVKDQDIKNYRTYLGIPEKCKMVLFASLYSLSDYSEHADFIKVLAEVKKAIFSTSSKIEGLTLVVKPHPLENIKETKHFADGCDEIIFAEPSDDIRELIKYCDVFITLGSTSTMDALIAHKLIIFPAFPGLVWWDDLYLKNNVTYEVHSAKELGHCLKSIVQGQDKKMLDELEPARISFLENQIYLPDGKAAARIAALAMEMAGIERRSV